MIIMARRNTWDLSDSDSIGYMKSRNILSLILWIAVLVICFMLIQYRVVDQYRQIGAGESVRNFRQVLVWGLVYILALSFLWWFGAANEFSPCAGMRNFFERRSLGCALVFDCLAAAGILLLSLLREFGISAKNGHFYSLRCPFILPAVFICLMYAAPPVNIQEVILPGNGRRWLVAGAAGLAAVGLFAADFI